MIYNMEEIDYENMDKAFLETQLDVLLAQLGRIRSNMKKAQKKYVANNRERINAIQRAYYHRHKDDPMYKERKKQHNKCYRERQHLSKIVQKENIEPNYIEAWEKQL